VEELEEGAPDAVMAQTGTEKKKNYYLAAICMHPYTCSSLSLNLVLNLTLIMLLKARGIAKY
jgi:hypothetical protein